MTQIEKQAWDLIVRMTPVQQYYFALKILQSVEPKEMEEVSVELVEESLHDKVWKGEDQLVELVLSRKQQMEEGKVSPLTLEEFAKDIQQRIEQHRS